MSTPAILYAGPKISPEVPWETRRHLQLLYQKLGNHTQAFSLVQSQIATLKAGSSSTTNTIIEGGGGSVTPGSGTGIPVNNQSGVVTYATVSGDNGNLLVFSDAAAIAVSLTTQTPPWGCYIANIGALGAGTVTLTPATGTINGAATLAILPTYWALVAFDGTNWWAATLPIVPVNTPAVAHEWLASYNAATGAFTLTQPKATDIATPYTAVSATYAILATDYQIECTANSFTVTLPTAVGIVGTIYSIKNSGTGTITVATTASQLIDGQLTQTLSQWSNIVVMSNGTGWIIL